MSTSSMRRPSPASCMVLGIQPGATENAAAVEDLLTQLVARGVKPEARTYARARPPPPR